jgi:integrase
MSNESTLTENVIEVSQEKKPVEPRRRKKHRQGGSILKMGSTYTIIFRNPDGKQKWQRGFPTKGAARDALTAKIREISENKYREIRPILFKDFADRWLEARKGQVKPSTWGSYRSALKTHIEPRFGTWELSCITRRDICEMRDALLAEGLSGKFVKNVFLLLQVMFNDALDAEEISANPAMRIKIISQSSERYMPPARDVVLTFGKLPGVYQVLLATGAVTGLRRAELLGLKWGNVDLERCELRVAETLQRVKKSLLKEGRFQRSGVEQIGKTGLALVSPKSKKSRRTVEVPPRLVELLKALRTMQNGSNDSFVFQDDFGRPLDPDAIYDVLRDAQTAAEVKAFGLHGLRHLYSSLLGESGAPVKHAQSRLGHASSQTTLDIYTHVLTDDGQKYAKRVEDAFPFVSKLLAVESENEKEEKRIQ